MANHTTGSDRYNKRMNKIFEEGKRLNSIHDAGRANHVTKNHGGVETYSSCKSCFPKDKSKAIKKTLEKASK